MRRYLLVSLLLIAPLVFAEQSVRIVGTDSTNAGRQVATDSSGNLKVVPAAANSSPGTSAANVTSTMAVVSQTVISTDATLITRYASTDWLAWPNLTVTISNTGSNAFGTCNVDWSPDNVTWETVDSTSCLGLAAGTLVSIPFKGNSRRYLRVQASATGGSNSTVFVTANNGQ